MNYRISSPIYLPLQGLVRGDSITMLRSVKRACHLHCLYENSSDHISVTDSQMHHILTVLEKHPANDKTTHSSMV